VLGAPGSWTIASNMCCGAMFGGWPFRPGVPVREMGLSE
jgi:hypothetical protein